MSFTIKNPHLASRIASQVNGKPLKGEPDAIHSSEKPWLDPTERAAVVLFDPEDAKKLVEERNSGNRPKSSNQLAYLEREVRGGYWRRNGQTIIFDKEGQVRDGQHRLTICAKTGIEIESWCVFGVDPEVFRTLDRTKRRTVNDDLALQGERYCSQLASSLSLVCLEEAGLLDSLSTGNGVVSAHDIEDALKRHPAIREACAFYAARRSLRRFLLPRFGTYCFHRFSQSNLDKAYEFFKKLESGEGLEAGSPVLLLRNRLMENRVAKAKLTPRDELALIIKAWNAFKAGKTITQLQWRTEGKTPEKFPAIS